MKISEAEQLYDTVIKNGYCIGCGSCASVLNTPFEMISASLQRL